MIHSHASTRTIGAAAVFETGRGVGGLANRKRRPGTMTCPLQIEEHPPRPQPHVFFEDRFLVYDDLWRPQTL